MAILLNLVKGLSYKVGPIAYHKTTVPTDTKMCLKALSQILHKHISAANRPMPKPRPRNIEHKVGLNVDVGVVARKLADTNSDRPVNLFVSQRCLKRAVSRPRRRLLRRPLTESRAHNVTLHNICRCMVTT